MCNFGTIGRTGSANYPPICCLAKQTLLGPMKGQSTKQKELPDSPRKSVHPDTTGSDHPKLEAECKCGK